MRGPLKFVSNMDNSSCPNMKNLRDLLLEIGAYRFLALNGVVASTFFMRTRRMV